MFQSWVGKNYFSKEDVPKTLILGESHYGDWHVRQGFDLDQTTRHNIQEQIDHAKTYPYYTKLVSSFIGHKPTHAERRAFWHDVAYHNLITTPMMFSRLPPTDTQWKESLPTLPNVLVSLTPDYIVVLGYRMWHRLTMGNPDMRPITGIRDSGPCGVRSLGQHYFHGIMHPSGPYSPRRWHTAIQSVKQQIWSNA